MASPRFTLALQVLRIANFVSLLTVKNFQANDITCGCECECSCDIYCLHHWQQNGTARNWKEVRLTGRLTIRADHAKNRLFPDPGQSGITFVLNNYQYL